MLSTNTLPHDAFNEEIYKAVLSKPSKKDGKFTRVEILRNGSNWQASKFTSTQVFHENFSDTATETIAKDRAAQPVINGSYINANPADTVAMAQSAAENVRAFITALFGEEFSHYTAWCASYEYSARVTKKGKVLFGKRAVKTVGALATPHTFAGEGFNRAKNHIIREGDNIPALVDMGVFTREGKVAAPMRDKFAQINRFLELLHDETHDLPPDTIVNIIDFGCGKSYLTFVVFWFFAQKRGLRANICGLDINPQVVEKCATAAKKYGYDSLHFVQGDIAAYTTSRAKPQGDAIATPAAPQAPTIAQVMPTTQSSANAQASSDAQSPPLPNWGETNTFNIVISLHACDTATDHALFAAVQWRADLICAAPCCQHQLRTQMKPRTLSLFSRYGIIKERVAALATDALRAKILEDCGYKTQIIEFTALEHTQKNLLIRARKTKKFTTAPQESEETRSICNEFGFKPLLAELFARQ